MVCHRDAAPERGNDSLDVLDAPLVRLPRAGVLRRGALWTDGRDGDPLEREAAAGPLDVPAPTPPPECRPSATSAAPRAACAPGCATACYGSAHPNEIVFYPRSRTAWVGRAMVRVETVTDDWDGEV